jgi:hypothetical protein
MKPILKHDDKESNWTNFSWLAMCSTRISRAKKFIKSPIVAKDFDCWQNELHPLPCGSPHTSCRFTIKFIVIVLISTGLHSRKQIERLGWENYYLQV